MAAVGTKTLLLGLVVAALAVAAVQALSVTILNPAGLLVEFLMDDKVVKVETDMVTMNITQAQQDVLVKVAEGEVMEVTMQDEDVFVLIPDPNDPLNAVLVLKMEVNGTELVTPPNPSPLPEVESTDPALPQVESTAALP